MRYKCEKCQLVIINNIPCHEFGCPDKDKPFIESTDSWGDAVMIPDSDYCPKCDSEFLIPDFEE